MSEWNRQEFLKSHVAMGEDVESSRFPELSTLSPAFFYQFVPVAKAPEKPEVGGFRIQVQHFRRGDSCICQEDFVT